MDHVMTRRTVVGAALAAAAAHAAGARAATQVVPFHGAHQAGITTSRQRALLLVGFDLIAQTDRSTMIALLRAWTQVVARRAASGSRFTATFGFGASFFDHAALAPYRPSAIGPLPALRGDLLDPLRGGGDLVVQLCADDARMLDDALRELTALAEAVAVVRFAQAGTCGSTAHGVTPRNALGFKDGTDNVNTLAALARHVWSGDEAPRWLRGGTTLVLRRIRIDLERWEAEGRRAQERAIGRHKASGAPLGRRREHDSLGLGRIDAQGGRVIPLGAHVRHAAAAENGGVRILRRGYNYDDGTDDAGLVFLSYQRSPERQTLRLLRQLATYDRLNPFVTAVASGVYVIPPGARHGGYVGETLLAQP